MNDLVAWVSFVLALVGTAGGIAGLILLERRSRRGGTK